MHSHKLMLVDLTISMFTGRKFDRAVTNEVAQLHNTVEAIGRYNKNLFPSNPPSYKAVVQAANQTRATHNSMTLPWDDAGGRVLAAKSYFEYNNAIRKQQNLFELATAAFVSEYPTIRAASLAILNGMASIDDFPSAGDIAEYFSIRRRVVPFPSAEDIRVDLPAAEVDVIKQQVTETTTTMLQHAMLDPVHRLHVIVTRMAETLKNPEAIFRDSLVTNLDDLRALLPALNVTDDPTLDALFTQTDSLVVHEPDTLRHSLETRSGVAEKAEALKQQLAEYFM